MTFLRIVTGMHPIIDDRDFLVKVRTYASINRVLPIVQATADTLNFSNLNMGKAVMPLVTAIRSNRSSQSQSTFKRVCATVA
jgi:hypothetical protein